MSRRLLDPLLGADICVLFDDKTWYQGNVCEKSAGRARPYKVRYEDGSFVWHRLNLESGEADGGRRLKLTGARSTPRKRESTPVARNGSQAAAGGSATSSKRRRVTAPPPPPVSSDSEAGSEDESEDESEAESGGSGSDGADKGEHEPAAGGGASGGELSAYERRRLACMARNSAVMASLGIAATMARTAAQLQGAAAAKGPGPARKAPRRRPRKQASRRAAPGEQRRSKRVAGLDSDGKALPDDFDDRKVRYAEMPVADDADSVSMLPSGPADLDPEELLVFNALRRHRSAVAEAQQMETYKVAHNRTLCELVRMRPANKDELLQVWGIKTARAEKYGDGLLAVLADPKHAKNFRSGPRPLLDAEDVEIDEASAEPGEGEASAGAGASGASGARQKKKKKARGGQRNGRRGSLGDVSEDEDEGSGGVCVFGGSITAYVRKYEGERWKGVGWGGLDKIKPPAGASSKDPLGTLALQHNRSHIYRKKVASGASLGDALQELARVGKQRCNPRITGFIKVVENTSFCFAAGGSYLPLATILEDQVCGKR